MRALDERLLRAARTHWHCARAESAVARFARLGEHGAVWLALGALGASLDRARARSWRRACETVLCAYALNTAVKLLVRRPRPRLRRLPPLTSTPSALSFPSAHAATSFAGARSFARLGLPRGPLYGLAAALSATRVYLGVHYPSDVLAGGLLGAALARLRARREVPLR